MRNVNYNIVTLVVCVVCVALFGLQFTTAKAEGRPVTKWEYRMERAGDYHSASDKNWTGVLNALGEEGWEAVNVSFASVHGSTSACYVTMKRPKQ